MKKKSKISLAKAIALGLVLSAGMGYSTGVSANDADYFYDIDLARLGAGDDGVVTVVSGSYGNDSVTNVSLNDYTGVKGFKTNNSDAITIQEDHDVAVGGYSLADDGWVNVVGNVKLNKDASITLTDMPVKGKIYGVEGSGDLTIEGKGTVGDDTYSVKAETDNAIENIGGNVTISGTGDGEAAIIIATAGDAINDVDGAVNVTKSSIEAKGFGIKDVSGKTTVTDSNIKAAFGIADVGGSVTGGETNADGVEVKNSTIEATYAGVALVAGDVTISEESEVSVSSEYGVALGAITGNLTVINSEVSSNGLAIGVVGYSGVNGSSLIPTDGKGNVTVTGSHISGVKGGIYYAAGDVEVTNSSVITVTDGDAINRVTGNATVVASTIEAGGAGLTNIGGKTTIDNSEITAKYGIKDVGGFVEDGNSVEVKNDSTITATDAGVVQVAGDVSISGSTVNVGAGGSFWSGWYNVDPTNETVSGVALGGITGDLTVEGSTINSYKGYAIQYVGYEGEDDGVEGKGNVTVTKGSTVYGTLGGIYDVNGDVTVKGESSVTALLGNAIDNVGGNVLIGKSNVTAVLGMAINDVEDSVTVRNGSNVTALGNAINSVGGGVTVGNSTVTSTTGNAINDVTGNVLVRKGATITANNGSAINDVNGKVTVKNSKLIGENGITNVGTNYNTAVSVTNSSIEASATGISNINMNVVVDKSSISADRNVLLGTDGKAITDVNGNLTVRNSSVLNAYGNAVDNINGAVSISDTKVISVGANGVNLRNSGADYNVILNDVTVEAGQDALSIANRSNVVLSSMNLTAERDGMSLNNDTVTWNVNGDKIQAGRNGVLATNRTAIDVAKGVPEGTTKLTIEANGESVTGLNIQSGSKFTSVAEDVTMNLRTIGTNSATAINATGNETKVEISNLEGDLWARANHSATAVSLSDGVTAELNIKGNIIALSTDGYVNEIPDVDMMAGAENANFVAIDNTTFADKRIVSESEFIEAEIIYEADDNLNDVVSGKYYEVVGSDGSITLKKAIENENLLNAELITRSVGGDEIIFVTGSGNNRQFMQVKEGGSEVIPADSDALYAVDNDGNGISYFSVKDGKTSFVVLDRDVVYQFAEDRYQRANQFGNMSDEEVLLSDGQAYTRTADDGSTQYFLKTDDDERTLTFKENIAYSVNGNTYMWNGESLERFNQNGSYDATAVNVENGATANLKADSIYAESKMGTATGIKTDADWRHILSGGDNSEVTADVEKVLAKSFHGDAFGIDANRADITLNGVKDISAISAYENATAINLNNSTLNTSASTGIHAYAGKTAQAIVADSSTLNIDAVKAITAVSSDGKAYSADHKDVSEIKIITVVDNETIAVMPEQLNELTNEDIGKIFIDKDNKLQKYVGNGNFEVATEYAKDEGKIFQISGRYYNGVGDDGVLEATEFDKNATYSVEGEYFVAVDGELKKTELVDGRVYRTGNGLQVWEERTILSDHFTNYDADDYKAVALDLNDSTMYVSKVMDGIFAEATVGNAYGIIADGSTIVGGETLYNGKTIAKATEDLAATAIDLSDKDAAERLAFLDKNDSLFGKEADGITYKHYVKTETDGYEVQGDTGVYMKSFGESDIKAWLTEKPETRIGKAETPKAEVPFVYATSEYANATAMDITGDSNVGLTGVSEIYAKGAGDATALNVANSTVEIDGKVTEKTKHVQFMPWVQYTVNSYDATITAVSTDEGDAKAIWATSRNGDSSKVNLTNIVEIGAYAKDGDANAIYLDRNVTFDLTNDDGAKVDVVAMTKTGDASALDVRRNSKAALDNVKNIFARAEEGNAVAVSANDNANNDVTIDITNVNGVATDIKAVAGKTAQAVVAKNNSTLTFDELKGITAAAFAGVADQVKIEEGNIKNADELVYGRVYKVDDELQVWTEASFFNRSDHFADYNPENYKAVALDLTDSEFYAPRVEMGVISMATVGNAYGIVTDGSIIATAKENGEGVSVPVVSAYAPNANATAMDITNGSDVGLTGVERVAAEGAGDATALNVANSTVKVEGKVGQQRWGWMTIPTYDATINAVSTEDGDAKAVWATGRSDENKSTVNLTNIVEIGAQAKVGDANAIYLDRYVEFDLTNDDGAKVDVVAMTKTGDASALDVRRNSSAALDNVKNIFARAEEGDAVAISGNNATIGIDNNWGVATDIKAITEKGNALAIGLEETSHMVINSMGDVVAKGTDNVKAIDLKKSELSAGGNEAATVGYIKAIAHKVEGAEAGTGLAYGVKAIDSSKALLKDVDGIYVESNLADAEKAYVGYEEASVGSTNIGNRTIVEFIGSEEKGMNITRYQRYYVIDEDGNVVVRTASRNQDEVKEFERGWNFGTATNYKVEEDYHRVGDKWFGVVEGTVEELGDNAPQADTLYFDGKNYRVLNNNNLEIFERAEGTLVTVDGKKWVFNDQGKLEFIATAGVMADGAEVVIDGKKDFFSKPFISVDAQGFGNAAGVYTENNGTISLNDIDTIYVHAAQDMAYGILAVNSTVNGGEEVPGSVNHIVANADESNAYGVKASKDATVSLTGVNSIEAWGNGGNTEAVYAARGADVTVAMAKGWNTDNQIKALNFAGAAYGIDAKTGATVSLKNAVDAIQAVALGSGDAYGISVNQSAVGGDVNDEVKDILRAKVVSSGELAEAIKSDGAVIVKMRPEGDNNYRLVISNEIYESLTDSEIVRMFSGYGVGGAASTYKTEIITIDDARAMLQALLKEEGIISEKASVGEVLAYSEAGAAYGVDAGNAIVALKDVEVVAATGTSGATGIGANNSSVAVDGKATEKMVGIWPFMYPITEYNAVIAANATEGTAKAVEATNNSTVTLNDFAKITAMATIGDAYGIDAATSAVSAILHNGIIAAVAENGNAMGVKASKDATVSLTGVNSILAKGNGTDVAGVYANESNVSIGMAQFGYNTITAINENGKAAGVEAKYGSNVSLIGMTNSIWAQAKTAAENGVTGDAHGIWADGSTVKGADDDKASVGSVTAIAANGNAMGVKASKDATVSLTGVNSIYAQGLGEDVKGVYARKSDVSIDMAMFGYNGITAINGTEESDAGDAYGVDAHKSNVTINNINYIFATGADDAYGVKASKDATVSLTGVNSIWAQGVGEDVKGVYARKSDVSIDMAMFGYNGITAINGTEESDAGDAYGVDAHKSNVTINNINYIFATGADKAYGVRAKDGARVSLGGYSNIYAEATDGNAYGINAGRNSKVVGLKDSETEEYTEALVANIGAVSKDDDAYGVRARNNAEVDLAGVNSIFAKGDGDYVEGIYASESNVSIDMMPFGFNTITAINADKDAYGIEATSSTVTLTGITNSIWAKSKATGNAKGISADGSKVVGVIGTDKDGKATYASASVKHIGAVATTGDAMGVEAKGTGTVVTLTGVQSISANSQVGNVYGIYNDGGLVNVNFSGSVINAVVDTNGNATAVYTVNGGTTNIGDDEGPLTINAIAGAEGGNAIGIDVDGTGVSGAAVTLPTVDTVIVSAANGEATLAKVANTDFSMTGPTGEGNEANVMVQGSKGQTLLDVVGGTSTDPDTISLENVNIALKDKDGNPTKNGTLLNAAAGSNTTLNLDNTVVDGVANVIAAGKVTTPDEVNAANVAIALTNGSSFNGAVNKDGTDENAAKVDMSLDNTSRWGVTGDSNVQNLTNDGIIDMVADGKGGEDFSTLTIDTLKKGSGKGTYKMDVNMNPEGGATDQVVVNAVEDGEKISLNIDTNIVNLDENSNIIEKLTGEDSPVIFRGDGVSNDNLDVSINGGKYLDLGATRAEVAISDPVKNATDEVTESGKLTLTPAKDEGGKQKLSAKGNAAMSAVIDPETWHVDNEALYENISNLRPERERSDVWASYTNKKNTYDDSFQDVAKNGDIDKRYSGVVLGIDNKAKYYQKANANLFVGVMFSYGDGKYNWADGSNELDGAGVGLYAIYKTAKGAYFGATAKYNRYSFDEIKGTQVGSGKSFNGEYDTNALGLSLVAGRRYAKDQMQGFYVEPQAELAYVNYGSDNYDLDGMDVEVNSMKSLRARLGFQIGSRNINKKTFSDIYAKVSFLHEFFGDNDVNMGAYTYESDQGGSWVNFALGFSVGSMDKFNANFSANLSRGSHKSKVGFKTVLNFLY